MFFEGMNDEGRIRRIGLEIVNNLNIDGKLINDLWGIWIIIHQLFVRFEVMEQIFLHNTLYRCLMSTIGKATMILNK